MSTTDNSLLLNREVTIDGKKYTGREIYELTIVQIHDLETKVIRDVNSKNEDLNMFQFIRHRKELKQLKPDLGFDDLMNKPYHHIDVINHVAEKYKDITPEEHYLSPEPMKELHKKAGVAPRLEQANYDTKGPVIQELKRKVEEKMKEAPPRRVSLPPPSMPPPSLPSSTPSSSNVTLPSSSPPSLPPSAPLPASVQRRVSTTEDDEGMKEIIKFVKEVTGDTVTPSEVTEEEKEEEYQGDGVETFPPGFIWNVEDERNSKTKHGKNGEVFQFDHRYSLEEYNNLTSSSLRVECILRGRAPKEIMNKYKDIVPVFSEKLSHEEFERINRAYRALALLQGQAPNHFQDNETKIHTEATNTLSTSELPERANSSFSVVSSSSPVKPSANVGRPNVARKPSFVSRRAAESSDEDDDDVRPSVAQKPSGIIRTTRPKSSDEEDSDEGEIMSRHSSHWSEKSGKETLKYPSSDEEESLEEEDYTKAIPVHVLPDTRILQQANAFEVKKGPIDQKGNPIKVSLKTTRDQTHPPPVEEMPNKKKALPTAAPFVPLEGFSMQQEMM